MEREELQKLVNLRRCYGALFSFQEQLQFNERVGVPHKAYVLSNVLDIYSLYLNPRTIREGHYHHIYFCEEINEEGEMHHSKAHS